jgi:membrane protein
MFDIKNYDIYTAFVSFIIVFSLLFFLFRKKSIGIIDPLTYHLLWISGNIAFLIAYTEKCGLAYISVLFFLIFIIYTIIILYLIKPLHIKYTLSVSLGKEMKKKLFFLYIVSIIILLYSKKPVFDFMLNNNIITWFLYRYKAIEGGQAFYRILDLGITPIFLYFSFYNLCIIKKYKSFTSVILILYLFLLVLTGGRSSFLALIFSFGGFVAFHRESFLTVKKQRRFNKIGKYLILFALVIAMFVSAMFEQTYSTEAGINTILNRVIATADGLEYYMKYDGLDKIHSGPYEYFMSIFSVYTKNYIDINYKNIGHQLSELATGVKLDFAQGSNYTLPLQVMVFNYLLMPIYVFVISLIVVKMRNVRNLIPNKINILGFFMFSTSFGIVGDIEFFVLRTMSFLVIYFLVFYPILKIKI